MSKKSKEEKETRPSRLLEVVGLVVAGTGFAAWGISKVLGSSSEVEEEEKKTMKPPGKKGGERIDRDDFERASMAVAGIGVAVWEISKLLGSTSDVEEEDDEIRKKMKAPGRNGEIIYRDDFERDPKKYFRDHRKDKKQEKLDGTWKN